MVFADQNLKNCPLPIDVLIGADSYWSFIEDEVIRGKTGPVALKSKLGYLLSGGLPFDNNCSVLSSHILKVQSEFLDESVSLKNLMSDLWDDIGNAEPDLDFSHDKFTSEIKFDKKQGRYEAFLPFKIDHPLLSDNYSTCIKRLGALSKKFSKNKELFENYNNIIKDQIKSGVIEEVSNQDLNAGDVHYLPHRPVVRNDKVTTKVRMVFDASSSSFGPSLNNCLHSGPSLTTSLFGILLRFRTKRYAFIADIEKAFLQISLNSKDRDFVRFLWYKDIEHIKHDNLPVSELGIFRLCRVLFGVTSSPFILEATLLKHINKFESCDPTFVKELLLSLHVDDFNSSCDSIEACSKFYNKCKSRLKQGSFNLRKFESNSHELEIEMSEDDFEPNSCTKVLGLNWNKNKEALFLSFDNLVSSAALIPTKRQVLHFVASLFDPLGLLNPVVVKLKILFQNICVSKIRWDEIIIDDFYNEWRIIIDDFAIAPTIYLPRWYLKFSSGAQFELHAFSDSSLKAYGGCVYLRCIFNCENQRSSLIASKSKVASISKSTVPRLELRGMMLLAELTDTIYQELKCTLNITSVTCWTDSTICLYWLKNCDKSYDVFIQRRLQKIRSLYNIEHWRYIESHRNPADVLSRGSLLNDLILNTLWFNGPDFLNDSSVQWPIFDLVKKSEEEAATHHIASDSNTCDVDLTFFDIEGFTDYMRLLRVTAMVLRFVRNIRKKVEDRNLSNINADDIEESKNMWIEYVQRDVKKDPTYKQLARDLRFREVDGIIRSQGRLENAPISFNSKFPIFIPRKCYLAKLIIIYCHSIVMHNGLKETLNELRTQYWIPRPRNLIKSIIGACYVCRRYEGKGYSYPLSPPLPYFPSE